MSFGTTPWVVAVGVIVWLAAVVVLVAGFLRSRTSFPSRDLGSGRCGSISSTTPLMPGRRPNGPDGSTRSSRIDPELLATRRAYPRTSDMPAPIDIWTRRLSDTGNTRPCFCSLLA
jgi:hypothetical protein